MLRCSYITGGNRHTAVWRKIMKKTFKRAVSVVSAAAVSLALVPIADYSFFSDAADQYSVRDPFYNYGSGYNYYATFGGNVFFYK